VKGGGPLQVPAEVLSVRRSGAYHHLTLLAAGVAERVRPGHFVAVAVDGPSSALLLRRAFSVYRAAGRGVYGGTVELVLAVHGAGTAWLAQRRPGDRLDLVGPLGRPFASRKLTRASPVASSVIVSRASWDVLAPSSRSVASRRCRRPAIRREARPPRPARGRAVMNTASSAISA